MDALCGEGSKGYYYAINGEAILLGACSRTL